MIDLTLKEQLDRYVDEYETKDFIPSDPVQFIHRFDDKRDIEIAGFIASMFAYGKREAFIEKLNRIFSLMDNKPLDFVVNFEEKYNKITDCDYRFSKTVDLVEILRILNVLYCEKESLETLFEYEYNETKTIQGMLTVSVDYFYSRVDTAKVTQGFYHLLPDPRKSSALKRMNMMLRWFVRSGDVDRGIWKFLDKSELLIPLDVHVGKISRKLGLLERTNNDFKMVKELTNPPVDITRARSEEHTSELQSHSDISYAVFCLDGRAHV